MTFQASTEADMTARNGKAEWHSGVERLAEPGSASGDRQSAAAVYASLVRRVGHLATRDGDLAGPLAA
jgi:hypothetical protein